MADITCEVRSLGRSLGQRGFVGPFGVDFIRDDRGFRHFHDMNPRMNGAVDNLSLYVADDDAAPLRVLLLCRRPWSDAEISDLECQLRFLARAHPMTRYFLSRELAEHYRVETVPAAGIWRIALDGDAGGPTLTRETDRMEFTSLSEQQCILRPMLAPGTTWAPGERLFLGDLYCTPALSRRLNERFGADVHRVLVDALLR